jgi:transposase
VEVAMAGPTLLPDHEQLELVELLGDETAITMVVRACRPTARCPVCGTPATRVHSRYDRTIADLLLLSYCAPTGSG